MNANALHDLSIAPVGRPPQSGRAVTHSVFRRIWLATMTDMTRSAVWGLVQSALQLPIALMAAPAGTAAMLDRRSVALFARRSLDRWRC